MPEVHPPDSLRRCVGDPTRFLRDHWAQRPHLHRRSGRDDFADLLSLDHVDHLVSSSGLRTPAFRLVREGSPLPPSSYTRSGTLGGQQLHDLADAGRVLQLFWEGATIVLQGLHRYWEPVARFCRELELFLTHPVQANAYVTPPVASGLRVHHDTHDVFALQTHGAKHWVVYAPVMSRPLVSQPWSSDDDPGPPEMDIELGAGDCLYVPRGTPHAARTVDQPSIHLTIGIRSYTWHDLFRLVADRAQDEIAFREELPVGFARDRESFRSEVSARLKEMAAWVEQADPDALAGTLADRFWTSRPPLLTGQLRQLLELDGVEDHSWVRRRPGSVAEMSVSDGRLRLELGDRLLEMPVRLEAALRRVLGSERLLVADLADLLDEPSRLVLVRRLVREGLLLVDG